VTSGSTTAAPAVVDHHDKILHAAIRPQLHRMGALFLKIRTSSS
jgi:hypothetical protein